MEDTNEYCVNCKRDIPSSNFVMHSMHCSRNITLCTLCEEPVPRTEMDAHQIEFHSLKECESCGEKLDVEQLKKHKTDSCPLRRINCSICELELAASEIFEHENYCGSRTERCEECKEYVMLKYKKLHLDSNHGFLKLDDEPGPTPSWQSNDKGAMNGVGTVNNDLRSQRKIHNSASALGFFVSSSPSKRTNDMPQVNSVPPPHTSKAVHKATIMGDSERQRNFNSADHVDSDVAALFSENLHLMKPSNPRIPSVAQSSYSREDDLVALPCEFCEALVPANQLILHQTACRPDLARFGGELSSTTTQNAQLPALASHLDKRSRIPSVKSAYKIHNNLMPQSPPSPPVSRREARSGMMDDTLLPCEFCHESFSVSQLYDHQTRCTVTWPEDPSPVGQASADDSTQISPLHNINSGSLGNEKNLELGAYKLMPKGNLKSNDLRSPFGIRHNRNSKEIKYESATSVKGRESIKHSFENARFAPSAILTSKVWTHPPSHFTFKLHQHTDVNEYEDEGRQALLQRANAMDRINQDLTRRKETSSIAQRNHVLSDLTSQHPHRRKQPNHFTSEPSSSHSLGSYPSLPTRPQSGRGGRTTGAIPKQKAGTSKSPIAWSSVNVWQLRKSSFTWIL